MVAAFFASAALSRAADPDIRLFFEAASRDEAEARAALERISAGWRDAYAALIVDLVRFMPPPRPRTGALTDSDPFTHVRERLLRFLQGSSGQSFGQDLKRWRQWMWKRPYEPHADYARFKSVLYAQIDPRIGEFFVPGARSLIRLDEVDWGGVKVNGIPPLDHPKHVGAREAAYLNDKNVVFGVFINGEARAYPKRILGWHEMARDRVGGVELTVVYCTLCGTVIPYGSEVGGMQRTFGTSGLLYRSNKTK